MGARLTTLIRLTKVITYSFDSFDSLETAPALLTLEEVGIKENDRGNKEVALYCIPLLQTNLFGQTSDFLDGRTDCMSTTDVMNVGLYLSLLDKYLRKFTDVTDFNGEEEEYQLLLRLVGMKRHKGEESYEDCYERLLRHSKRFVKIYHDRGTLSQPLVNTAYWGTRQQMLSGKVIADWIDRDNGPLDPVFGVLLNPTAGRVGKGDGGLMHNMLFDGTGPFAYHACVHDAFGYLHKVHKTGPGYEYLDKGFLHDDNPMAGQLSGIAFWKKVLKAVDAKGKLIEYTWM